VRWWSLSRTRTTPWATLTRVPSQLSVVCQRVPIAAADTAPVAVCQLPPVSETQSECDAVLRRCFLRLAFRRLSVTAAMRAAARVLATRATPVPQPVSDERRNAVDPVAR
jgi:uncharacterized membrane protein YdbT with pleckstrin-like domain